MRDTVAFICTAIATALVAGCGDPVPTPRPAPATAPATTQVATAPATTQAALAVFNVNGRDAVCPPARLRLENDGKQLVAMLFSDDPKEALKRNYTGNSFYFRMQLDISDPAELGQAQWHYQARSASDEEDSPYGIFLGGRKTQLEPLDVRAQFRSDGTGVVAILLSGHFRVIDGSAERRTATTIPVAAELAAQLDKSDDR